jgi:hypothetical protein
VLTGDGRRETGERRKEEGESVAEQLREAEKIDLCSSMYREQGNTFLSMRA